MSRTLGFFLGSAVVFGMLVLILGQPVSLAPPGGRDMYTSTQTMTGPIRIPAPVRQTEQPVGPLTDTAPALVAPVAGSSRVDPPEPTVATVSSPDTGSGSRAVTTPVTQQAAVVDENELAATWLKDNTESIQSPDDTADINRHAHEAAITNNLNPVPNDPAIADGGRDTPVDSGLVTVAAESDSQLEWFAVWDPFHSELSANAFARRLERVTGLDYRVIKTAAAQYSVVMGYVSEEQRTVNLSLIEQATGLSISGSSL